MSGPLGPLIAILLCFLLPGLTWGPLLAPGRLSDLGRLGRAIGASIVVTSILATALVVFGRLEAATALVGLVILTALPLGSSRVRRDLRESVRTRRRLAPAAIAVAALAVAAVHLARSHAVLGPESLPATSTVWYYAHLADLVGSSGGLPAQFPEWGGLRPFQTDYLPFTAHSAMAFSLMGVDIVAGLEIYRLAILAAAIAIAHAPVPSLDADVDRPRRGRAARHHAPDGLEAAELQAGDVRVGDRPVCPLARRSRRGRALDAPGRCRGGHLRRRRDESRRGRRRAPSCGRRNRPGARRPSARRRATGASPPPRTAGDSLDADPDRGRRRRDGEWTHRQFDPHGPGRPDRLRDRRRVGVRWRLASKSTRRCCPRAGS